MKISTLKKILALVAIVCGIVACCLMFAPAVTLGEGDSATTYAGNFLAFGKTYDGTIYGFKYGSVVIEFSIGALLAYVLPLIAALVLFIGVFMKKNVPGFIFGAISFGVFVAGLIMLICIRNMASYHGVVLGNDLESSHFTDWSMAAGLITTIVFTAIGICASGSFTVLNLLKSPKTSSRKKRK